MNADIDITGVVLKTERLILREWKEPDLADLFEYAKVEGVGEMAGWPHHESIEVSQEILNRFIAHKRTFAIEYNGKVIGSLGIETYNEEVLPEFNSKMGREIGYVLSKDYWGQGLMPEAVKRVIDYCFDELHLDFLTCCHYDFNNQSRRVQEKSGFKHYKHLPDYNPPKWVSLILR